MLLIDANLLNAAISPSQSPMMQPHFINLNQFEMSIVHCMRQDPSGKWSCELCDAQFNDIIILATHLLTSCDHDCDDDSSSPTFSNKSAVDICMLLDEAKSIKMFESYVSVANEESDIEDCDLEDDTHSEASGPRYTDHEEDNEVGIEDEEDKGPVWWVSEEDESNESVDEDTTFEKQDKDLKRGSAATKGVRSKNVKRRSAVAKTVRMPRNQEFPALPPHSLSPDAKSEWTFRRDRKCQLIPPATGSRKRPSSDQRFQAPVRSGTS